MSYSKRVPPLRFLVDIDTFNNINELLTRFSEVKNELWSQKAIQIKEKLLKYSVPYTEENGNTMLDIRFFNTEAIAFIYVLLENISNYSELHENFYETLINYRKQKEGR